MTRSAGAAARTPLHRLRESPIWIAVILATLTIFGPLSMDLYLPVLPSLAADLATTTSAAQLTMTTCLLGLALGQVIAGPLSDRYGRRVVLLGGLVVYTVASLACAFSDSITLLVVLRLVQGAAGGFGLVIAQACGRDLYEGPRLNRYNGRIVVLSGLAAIVAPVIGGVLAAYVAWQGFFVLLAAFGLVITLAVAVSFRETLPVERRVTGGAGHTLAHLAVLARDRRFVGATLASSLTSATYFAYLAAAPFVLQDLYGLSPAQYALVIAVNAAGFAAFGFTAGRAAERWGERTVFATGIAIVIAGAAVLAATATAPPPLAVMVGAFLLIAAGAAAVSPPSTTMALTDYPAFAGTASSVLGLSRFVAGAAAAPLVGLAGPLSTTPLAAVALATGLASAVVFTLLLVRGRAPRPSSGAR
ncbi:multidrug effflux MFS transporter [Agromyces mangrovi Wang et al. 2018]|uniref:multidrug effflux MFS transporter n=1 Tax=Agromyces mangrovi TaxID=1858653 RepID=UPI0025736BBB|nr:multidrug effflux MFS transporter [Agromyces mangrovi]BDZ64346.1 Bcr/CflA family drug resistance efflux transporter [Agromyces mangrovi]